MSRCFPFPPPGYEKKPIVDDIDLLKKEKRKEKKHKKDKKDREKKEGKEKRGEKTDEKHKEKKDKKDKHKDKKKDKENGKDKEKSTLQLRNGEHKEQILRNEESCKVKEDVAAQNRVKGEDIDHAKFVQELSRRIRDVENEKGSLQFPIESRKTSVERFEMVRNSTMPVLDKEKIREKEKDEKRKKKDGEKEKQGKKKDLEKGSRPKEEKVKEKIELLKAERDKYRFTKNNEITASPNNLSSHSPNVSIQRGGIEIKKRKDMETNGFSHENELRPNKTARSTSNILTENGRKLETPGFNLPRQQGPTIATLKVDNKERKVNGIIGSQPMPLVSKKPLLATPNHILRKPTPTRSPTPPVTTDHIATPPLSAPKIKPQVLVSKPVSATKPTPVVSVTNKVVEQPLPNLKKKPPHPDTKYLKQILTVPELDHWSGVDDQEWLFSTENDPVFNKRIRDDSLRDNEFFEVWSEAKRLESVDICALPYVIPY